MSNSTLALRAATGDRRTFPARTTNERYKPTSRQFNAGVDLFRPGEQCGAIHYLVEGCVFLYDLLEDGRRQILHFALPGAILGLYPSGIATYGAQALMDTIVSLTPHDSLEPLFEKHPKIGLQLAHAAWRERNFAYDHLSSIGQRSARERVARLLLELFIRYRMRWPGSYIEEMHLPLTQEHIGDATGLTNVHVNRVLRDLRKEGILEFHYRRLRIMDPDKLVDIAGIDRQVALSWIENNSAHESFGGLTTAALAASFAATIPRMEFANCPA